MAVRCSRLLLVFALGGNALGGPHLAEAQPRPGKFPGKSEADKAARAGKEDAERAAAADASARPGEKPDPADKPDPEKEKEAKPAPGNSPNRGKKRKVEYVVAVVNDAIILNSELETRRTPTLGEAQQITDAKERERRIAKLTSQVLDEMVNEELIVQAAEAAKIEVEASDIQAALDSVKEQNNFDDAGLLAAVSGLGYNLASYKQEVRRQLLRYRAINQLVSPKVQVTDEDIRARYDQMARRTEQVQAVRLSHILFKLPEHPSEQQIAAARDRAAQAIERIKGGEEFAKVAAQESDDEGTKATGGELGWFQRGSMANPAWEPIVFAMEKGDIRGPVNGPTGLHVFLVSEIKRSDLKPFADMKEQLSRELRRREMDKQTQTWVEELRKKAYIDIKLQ